MLPIMTPTTRTSGKAEDGARTVWGLKAPASSDAASSAASACQNAPREAQEQAEWLHRQLVATEMRLALAGLVPIVAHEVNNALTVLLGSVQLVGEIPNDEETRLLLNRVTEEAQRITRIIHNLLTFTENSLDEPVYVDVNMLLTNILELLAYDLRVDNVELETGLEPHLPPTIGNAYQLRYLFFHLIESLRERMGSNHKPSTLSIRTSCQSGLLDISIGNGHAGSLPPRRGDGHTLEGELHDARSDLFLCWHIARQHHGRLWVDNHPGRGVAFHVELPVATWPAQPATASTSVPEDRPVGSRILVADDERDIAALVLRALETEGYQIDTVHDGNAALAKLQTQKYDLVLLNLRMPGADGETVYRYLQATAPSRARRVIFLTGDTSSAETQGFLESTGNPYIAKPFALDELKTLVWSTLAGLQDTL